MGDQKNERVKQPELSITILIFLHTITVRAIFFYHFCKLLSNRIILYPYLSYYIKHTVLRYQNYFILAVTLIAWVSSIVLTHLFFMFDFSFGLLTSFVKCHSLLRFLLFVKRVTSLIIWLYFFSFSLFII